MIVSQCLRSDAPGLSSSDANDRFIRSHCARWGSRVLARYPRLDRETLEFVIWVLDPMSGILEHALSGIGINVDPALSEVSSSADDQAYALVPLLGRPGTLAHAEAAKALVAELERLIVPNSRCAMARSLSKISKTYGLSEDECSLAFFLASISAWPYAERFFDNHLECDRPTGRKYLLAALDMTHTRMSVVLRGRLPRIGILNREKSWISLDSDFKPLFTDPSEASSLKCLHRQLPKPDVTVQGLSILESDLNILRCLLSQSGPIPIHILLYGPPGTGKTSLVRGIIQELRLDGLEVMGLDDGTLKSRRSAIEACWNMASGIDGRILVVDEADHILGTAQSWFSRGEASDKAWINDLLERPGVRCIWIVNETDYIDPAVQRRFDFSLNVTSPSARCRKDMLTRILRRYRIKRHFDAVLIHEITRDYPVSPAVLASAAHAASLTSYDGSLCRSVFRRALNAKVELSAGKRIQHPRRKVELLRDGLNMDMTLAELEMMICNYDKRLRNKESANRIGPFNILFHGMPGSGKSLTARYLADIVDRPVHHKKASDLLDPYVGMTEKNISEAFTLARRDEAVLVIDEIDSLLSCRERAQRAWEVTKVNEMLTQMEQPGTILIGTTNRFTDIDTAAVRRFFVSVRYDALKPEQVVSVAKSVWKQDCVGTLNTAQLDQLRDLTGVTVADIVRVKEHLTLIESGHLDFSTMADELAKSLRSRSVETKFRIGFS